MPHRRMLPRFKYYNDGSQETTLEYLFMVNYRRVDSFAPLPATKQFPVKRALNWRSVVVILERVAAKLRYLSPDSGLPSDPSGYLIHLSKIWDDS